MSAGQRADALPPELILWFFVHATDVAAVVNTGKIVLRSFAYLENFWNACCEAAEEVVLP